MRFIFSICVNECLLTNRFRIIRLQARVLNEAKVKEVWVNKPTSMGANLIFRNRSYSVGFIGWKWVSDYDQSLLISAATLYRPSIVCHETCCLRV